jgi:hypothetical protein
MYSVDDQKMYKNLTLDMTGDLGWVGDSEGDPSLIGISLGGMSCLASSFVSIREFLGERLEIVGIPLVPAGAAAMGEFLEISMRIRITYVIS